MTKVVVIENQYTHFNTVYRHLSNARFSVYPAGGINQSPFKEFIDLVRVFLNERYDGGLVQGSRRSRALDGILTILRREKPDIILVDYVLVGNHDSKKGTHLASELRSQGIIVPMIFLSRTEPNQLETMNTYQQVAEPKEWIHKGYAGRRILEEEYFRDEVIGKFDALLGKSGFLSYESSIQNLGSSTKSVGKKRGESGTGAGPAE